jgi:hypothetical protein
VHRSSTTSVIGDLVVKDSHGNCRSPSAGAIERWRDDAGAPPAGGCRPISPPSRPFIADFQAIARAYLNLVATTATLSYVNLQMKSLLYFCSNALFPEPQGQMVPSLGQWNPEKFPSTARKKRLIDPTRSRIFFQRLSPSVACLSDPSDERTQLLPHKQTSRPYAKRCVIVCYITNRVKLPGETMLCKTAQCCSSSTRLATQSDWNSSPFPRDTAKHVGFYTRI